MYDGQRAKLQEDSNYRKKLVEDVVDHIRLRPYAGQYFRLNQFILGDEFLFFSIPYKLFAICIYGNQILSQNKNIFFLICFQ